MVFRTSQSAEVADLIRSGFSVAEALHRVLVMSDGTSVSANTSDVLADLQDMGVWSPTPARSKADLRDMSTWSPTPARSMELRHNPALYRKGKRIREACWAFHAVCYDNDEERRLLRATFPTEAAAREAATAAGVTPSVI